MRKKSSCKEKNRKQLTISHFVHTGLSMTPDEVGCIRCWSRVHKVCMGIKAENEWGRELFGRGWGEARRGFRDFRWAV